MSNLRIVAALGGNAVSRAGEEGNLPQQFSQTRASIKPLTDLIAAGHRLVLTHGNGPQVGNVLRRIEIARKFNVYPLSLDIAVADTQGGMGYMIAQCLMNELQLRGMAGVCTPIVTTVRVDPNDPAFQKPSKPVGAFMEREVAEEHASKEGWRVVEDAGRGWRRVVASPIPLEIVELPVIRRLVDAGDVVIACGGGGIPVARGADGMFTGVEAVIDKDRTSALLATEMEADVLMILTGVERVAIGFGKPGARELEKMSMREARKHLASGEFPAGSMGPKIEAAIDFLDKSREKEPVAIITACETAGAAMAGLTGTRIVRD